MDVQIKRLTRTATIPTRGSEEAAGYDLYADVTDDTVLHPGETVMIPLGISMAVPKGCFAAIFARSGLAAREMLRPGNCVGVVDSDYRGEWKVPLHNDSKEDKTETPGERIAQMVILPYVSVSFDEVESLDETARGTGGFGSTGK